MIGIKLCADPKCHCDSRNRQCYCFFLAHNVPRCDLNLRSQNPFEKLTALLAQQVEVKKALEEVEMDWLAAQEELEAMLQA